MCFYWGVSSIILEFKISSGDHFEELKHLAWNQLEPKFRATITALLSTVQQERVSQVAPVLESYLKLKQKYRVESHKSIVSYNFNTNILTYYAKNESEHLFAKRSLEGKWQDLGSNISQDKATYFLEVATKEIAKIAENKLKKSNFTR